MERVVVVSESIVWEIKNISERVPAGQSVRIPRGRRIGRPIAMGIEEMDLRRGVAQTGFPAGPDLAVLAVAPAFIQALRQTGWRRRVSMPVQSVVGRDQFSVAKHGRLGRRDRRVN